MTFPGRQARDTALRLQTWSSARSLLLLTAVTLACLLPFSGKAFNIDDPLFVWSAQQIAKQPLDPYGFQVIWYRTITPMSQVMMNPPLASYYAAMIGAVAGWSERALHLGFLLPTLALVLGIYRLAQRLTRSPLVATAATLLTPGVLVSASSVMCDIMMLAFWIWAILFWLEGLESGKQRYWLAAGLLMAAAALTKYFGICLVPLLFVYSVARQRRLGAWAWYFVLPISLLAGYEFCTSIPYGHGLLSAALLYAPQRAAEARSSILLYPFACASFIGGCTLSALALAPLVWPRKYILIVLLVEAAVFAAAWVIFGSHLRATHTGMALHHHGITIGPELALCIAGGVSVLALAALDLWEHRDAESFLLALWVFGTFVFTAFVNWTINARSILPLIPAAGILLARRLDALGIASAKPLQWKVAIALVISGLVSLWIAKADADWANSARQAAQLIAERTSNQTGAVWFQGHWGFQYYMEQLGMHPFDFNQSTLRQGDLLVIPRGDTNIQTPPAQFVASDEMMEIPLRQPVMTMHPALEAGFYASFSGVLPFGFGKVPPEPYHVFRMGTTTRAVQWAHPQP